jgi:hypothetical protein
MKEREQASQIGSEGGILLPKEIALGGQSFFGRVRDGVYLYEPSEGRGQIALLAGVIRTILRRGDFSARYNYVLETAGCVGLNKSISARVERRSGGVQRVCYWDGWKMVTAGNTLEAVFPCQKSLIDIPRDDRTVVVLIKSPTDKGLLKTFAVITAEEFISPNVQEAIGILF